MIKILIPNNNIEERKYSIDFAFKTFLGLDYEINVDNIDTYQLELNNHNKLILNDSFFIKHPKSLEYLDSENIPSQIEFVENKFLAEKDIPLIFGNNEIKANENLIYCGIDIFASIFFMLSRWEEYANKTRDKYGRFQAEESLAFKNNFLDRPVVNEYCLLLWNLIYRLDNSLIKKKQENVIYLTHDIDLLSRPIIIRNFASDLKRFKFRFFIQRFIYFFSKKNPYDTFDFLMDLSESIKVKSCFYFMTGHNVKGRDGEDYNNKRLFKTAISKIKERGHIVGFHPSYNSYNNKNIFSTEKKLLEEISFTRITEGRQHALRFELPLTWQIWDDSGMEISSTMGYSSFEGFRCGTGNEFQVFNILTRKTLQLRERPLIVMDSTLNTNRKLSVSDAFSQVWKFLEIGKRFDMPITLLFHNSSFDNLLWKGWRTSYVNLIHKTNKL
jgi:hypothetical protein